MGVRLFYISPCAPFMGPCDALVQKWLVTFLLFETLHARAMDPCDFGEEICDRILRTVSDRLIEDVLARVQTPERVVVEEVESSGGRR